jgi:hypothetical protein
MPQEEASMSITLLQATAYAAPDQPVETVEKVQNTTFYY